MITDYHLPLKLSEKYRLKFLKNTMKLGKIINFEGFVVSLKNSEYIRDSLWMKLSPIIGDFSVMALTPFPEENFPLILLIIPTTLKKKARIARIEGKLYDLSQFSSLSGRFVLVENMERLNMEKYVLLEKTGLDGRKIYRIFDSSFPEMSRDVFLSYFMASSQYIKRIGGCTVTLLDSLSKYYTDNFKPVEKMLGEIPSLLRKESFKVHLQYDELLEATIALNFKIRYQRMKERNAFKFYSRRMGKEWEKSALTSTKLRMGSLIGYSEIPYLPRSEEMDISLGELREYAYDIGSYVFQKHIEEKSIDEKYVERFKEKFIRKIDSEFPELAEAIRLGILMDMSDVNGFGEHIARMLNAWERLEFENSDDVVLSIYLTLFERLDDLLHDKIKMKISALGEKKRVERIINRVLWELNSLKPEGWTYQYFERKMKERGIEDRIEKLFQNLINEGYIINMGEKYRAIANL